MTVDDLSTLKRLFASKANLDDVASAINALAEICSRQQSSKLAEAHTLLERIQGALSNTASLVQLSDSYLGHGTVDKVVALVLRLVTYLSL